MVIGYRNFYRFVYRHGAELFKLLLYQACNFDKYLQTSAFTIKNTGILSSYFYAWLFRFLYLPQKRSFLFFKVYLTHQKSGKTALARNRPIGSFVLKLIDEDSATPKVQYPKTVRNIIPNPLKNLTAKIQCQSTFTFFPQYLIHKVSHYPFHKGSTRISSTSPPSHIKFHFNLFFAFLRFFAS